MHFRFQTIKIIGINIELASSRFDFGKHVLRRFLVLSKRHYAFRIFLVCYAFEVTSLVFHLMPWEAYLFLFYACISLISWEAHLFLFYACISFNALGGTSLFISFNALGGISLFVWFLYFLNKVHTHLQVGWFKF